MADSGQRRYACVERRPPGLAAYSRSIGRSSASSAARSRCEWPASISPKSCWASPRPASFRASFLVAGPPASIRGRRVLVVDETCDTGNTLKLALSEVRALRPREVRTAVSFKTGEYSPDFLAFATEKLIILPWDREIIQGGELVMRPDYAAWLGS
jgi:hypothetical protein